MNKSLRRFFSSKDYLQGIKNNRLRDNDRLSYGDSWFDMYSRTDVAYPTNTGTLESRGINKRVRGKANGQRRKLDKYRSAIDG